MQPLENIDSHKIKKHGMKLPQPTRTCAFLHDHKATCRNQQNTYATCLAQQIWLQLTDATKGHKAIHHTIKVTRSICSHSAKPVWWLQTNVALLTSVVHGNWPNLFPLQFNFCDASSFKFHNNFGGTILNSSILSAVLLVVGHSKLARILINEFSFFSQSARTAREHKCVTWKTEGLCLFRFLFTN